MSNRTSGSLARCTLFGVLVLAAASGCDFKPSNDAAPNAPTGPTPTTVESPTTVDTPPDASGPSGPGQAPPSRPAAPAWPSNEDCVSYNPANVTVHYEAGIYSVNDGSQVVMRVSGGPGETVGEKGLALAKRYRRHCFIGRDNGREDENAYVFDYWRDLSGMTPAIPGQEDDCRGYDRNNLTVDDMGGGHGWRVRDDDNVLHVFDNESDARNGKLVLSKYRQICSIGGSGEDDPKVVSYSL